MDTQKECSNLWVKMIIRHSRHMAHLHADIADRILNSTGLQVFYYLDHIIEN
jgi:hypothetical protein